ncbi:MAG: hypothetical protein OXG77_08150 [Chloroflexi bacterium]|nr:hypothetical protein [Chloroflexota bacterium]
MAARSNRPHNRGQRRRQQRESERVSRRTQIEAEHRLAWRQLPQVLRTWNRQSDLNRTQAGTKLVQAFAWLITLVLLAVLGSMLYYNRIGIAGSAQARIGESTITLRQVAIERDLQRWRSISGLNALAAAVPEFADFAPTEESDELARGFFAAESGAIDDLIHRQLLADHYAETEFPAQAEYASRLAEYGGGGGAVAEDLAERIGVDSDELDAHLRGLALEDYALAQARAAVAVSADQVKLLILRSTDRDLLEELADQLEAGDRDQVIADDAENTDYTAFDYGWSVRERIPATYVDDVWEQPVGEARIFNVADASDILFFVEGFESDRTIEAETLADLQAQAEDRFYLALRTESDWTSEELTSTAESWLTDNGLDLPALDARVADHYGIAV